MNQIQNSNQLMVQNLMPKNIPQVDGDTGFISDYFMLKKQDRINRSSKNELEIMENKVNTALSVMKLMHEMTMYQDRIELERETIKHHKKMMRHDREYRSAEITKINLESQLLQDQIKQSRANFILDSKLKECQVMEAEYSAKTSELEYKLRLKAMEAEYDR